MLKFLKDRSLQSNPFVNWLEVLIILLALWFSMSGIFDEKKIIFFGIASSLVISWYITPSLVLGGLKSDKNYFMLHVNPFKLAAYFFWLIREIIKSALSVSKVILSPGNDTEPQLVWFKADYDNPLARALLANSITLTPGTITIDIFDDGVYSCHCLTNDTREGLVEGIMQKKVAELFGEEIDYGIVSTTFDEGYDKRRNAFLIKKKYHKGKYINMRNNAAGVRDRERNQRPEGGKR